MPEPYDDLERRLSEQSLFFLSEAILISQIEQFHQSALQCVREYQDILIQIGAARAKREYAWEAINTGALALSLVLTCGGALVAKGVLRGQGLYARFAMTPLARAQAAGRSFQAVKKVQVAIAAMPKTLVPPAFVIRTIQELPVRLVISAHRTAVASVFLGPIVVGGKLLCQESNPASGMVQGKFGIMRNAARGYNEPCVAVSDSDLLRTLHELAGGMEPTEAAMVTMDPADRVFFIAMLHHQAEQAIRSDPNFRSLSEEQRLHLTSKAMMEYWYDWMKKMEQRLSHHQGVLQRSRARLAELQEELARLQAAGAGR